MSLPMRYNTAVRQHRRSGSKSLDFLPTQPWAVRALMETVLGRDLLRDATVLEPCNGAGDLARALLPYAGRLLQSDIVDYRLRSLTDAPIVQRDFFDGVPAEEVDWVITNPPFNKAASFIRHALSFARRGVAVVVRTSFLEGIGRYTDLYRETPPDLVVIHSERVPMFVGRLDAAKSTATSYAWLVWRTDGAGDARTVWIPPSRKALERADDYHGWRHFPDPAGMFPRFTVTAEDDPMVVLPPALALLRPTSGVIVGGGRDRGVVTLLEGTGDDVRPLARINTPPGMQDAVAAVAETAIVDKGRTDVAAA